MSNTVSNLPLDELVLLVVPHDDHVELHDLADGMFVTMRLIRYTDILNGWHSVPNDRDSRIRFITEDMKPTLRDIGLLQGDRPTDASAITMVKT